LSSISATSPIFYNSSTGVISSQAATSGQNGYLTSTDWSTFNGKQAALVSGTNIKTINGNSLLGSGDLTVSGGATSVWGETPSGTINGSNTSFTLAHNPAGMSLFLNGQRLTSGTDYTQSGTTLTMITVPLTGDILRSDYSY